MHFHPIDKFSVRYQVKTLVILFVIHYRGFLDRPIFGIQIKIHFAVQVDHSWLMVRLLFPGQNYRSIITSFNYVVFCTFFIIGIPVQKCNRNEAFVKNFFLCKLICLTDSQKSGVLMKWRENKQNILLVFFTLEMEYSI